MMCGKCKAGGDKISGPNKEQPKVREEARDLHSQCEHPATCTCLHRVPKSGLENANDKQRKHVLVADDKS